MKPAPFSYLRPASKHDALRLLDEHRDDDAKILAGGQSLVPMMNFRMAQPGILIDINRIAELAFVEEREETIAIGALTRHNDVKDHPLVRLYLPLVSEAYGNVAHHTIRNRGTIGGNVVHADSASEIPLVLTTLDAEFVVESVSNTRKLTADDFFLGVFTTGVEPDELLTEIQVPKPASGAGCAFEEVSLRKGDFAMAAVAAEIVLDGEVCRSARIGVGGIAERALRASIVEDRLVGRPLSSGGIAAAIDAELDGLDFSDGTGISAAYRRDLTRALLLRTIERASKAAKGRAS